MSPRHIAAGVILLLIVSIGRIQAGDAESQRQLVRLREAIPGLSVSMDQRLGVAGHVMVPGGFLAVHGAAPQAQGQADPLQPALAFIDAYPAIFGGGSAVLRDAVVVRNAVDAHNGLRSVIWQQVIAGVQVHRGRLSAHITKQGDLVSIGSHVVPDCAIAPKRAAMEAAVLAASRDGRSAVQIAVGALGDTAVDANEAIVTGPAGPEARQEIAHARLKGRAEAHLVWFPVSADDVRLAWDLVCTSVLDGKMYELVVGVADGAVHERRCLTVEDRLPSTAESGRTMAPMPRRSVVPANPVAQAPPGVVPAHSIALRVFASDSPTPMSPGWPTSSTAQPAAIARDLVTLVNLDPTASPNGWMDEALGDTRGNNVDAHTDLTDDDVADTPRPHSSGSPPTFDFACDLTQAPSTYRDAAVTNLFYWCNLCHDRLYTLGFTEAFGNFQNDNYGRGGLGGDAVQADAQDGGGTNNANFSTPADGSAGRMQMYVFTTPTPDRDGDVDATVIIHEYCHGLSNRLVGGGVGGMYTLQAGGMGEGWSDFMALCLLTQAGDALTGTYPVGGYVVKDAVSDNYYRGIRRYPYVYEAGVVTGSSKNPLTFSDIRTNAEVHDMGEVWCQTLWEARANLILKLGDTVAGNNLIMRLVVDGMKLTPADPTFLQARDAIIQADLVQNGGSNRNELWNAFAKRGMGVSAYTASSASTADVVEAFDLPGDLRVSPGSVLAGRGPQGGPFSPYSTTYTLSNANPGAAFTWTAVPSQPWLSVSPGSGTLASGQTTTVTATFSSAAQLLTNGNYSATIAFTNTTDGSGSQSRAATLQVATNYSVATTTMAWIAPDAHTALSLTDDSASAAQTLPFTFSFYGQPYTTLYVGSNGLLGFGSAAGVWDFGNVAISNAAVPNAAIYLAWDDLNPAAGGSVRFGSEGVAPNRKVVVSWVDVPKFYNANSRVSMQVVLREGQSDIVVNYLEVSPGQSDGSGRYATVGVENATGDLACQFSYLTASLSNNLALRYYIAPPQAPTVATPAVATPSPVRGRSSTTLTALGADVGDAALLTYTWSVLGTPPAGVSFSPNATHAAMTSIASFTAIGTYDLRCTIANDYGLTTASDVSVRVVAPTVAVHAAAHPATVAGRSGTSILTVLGDDEAGGEAGLIYTWSVLGTPPGSVPFSPNGSTAAKSTTASFPAVGTYVLRVSIADGTGLTATDQVSVQVTNAGPTVATPAAAPSSATGTTTALTVLGADDGGEAALTYTWTLVSGPAAVQFSPNASHAAKAATATFSQAGSYSLRCTIADAEGLTATSMVAVMVNQTLSTVLVSPATSQVAQSGQARFQAAGSDQFGVALAAPATFAWTLSSPTSGAIDASTGLFTANAVIGGPYTVTATSGGQSGTATVSVIQASSPADGGGGGGGSSCGLGSGLVALLGLVLIRLGVRNRQRRV